MQPTDSAATQAAISRGLIRCANMLSSTMDLDSPGGAGNEIDCRALHVKIALKIKYNPSS